MPKKIDKTCFIIAPIGEEGSESRKWSDQVRDMIIRPACEECGYKVERADDIQESGAITSQVIQRCAEYDLVIANLTDHNPNVFYELALRHAVGKPVIQLIQKGQPIPFDVGPLRTIFYDKETPTSFLECQKELIEFMKNIDLEKLVLDNPITSSIGLVELKSSSNPLIHATSEILSLLQDIQSSVKDLKSEKTKEKQIPGEFPRNQLLLSDKLKKAIESMLEGAKFGYCEICQLEGILTPVKANPFGSPEGERTLLVCPDCKSELRKS